MNKDIREAEVLVVGAGPTGLVLALWLKRKGIAVRIVDKSATPGETSRAIAVQARTLEFYRQLGIDQRLIALGQEVLEVTLRRKGKKVAVAKLGALGQGASPFPYLLFCPQDWHEGMLCEVLQELGVEVERSTEVTALREEGDRVIASLQKPTGLTEVTVQYVCGCDGAHSFVRHALDIPFQGGSYDHIFFVADAVAAGEALENGLQISVSRKSFCIVLPLPKENGVRLIGIVPPESEQKASITYEDVAEMVTQDTGLKVNFVNGFSTYRVHHRMAEHFSKGRNFLLGDAAHIHSPAGGQGMNTGIGDAINLAWKLADVLRGRLDKKVLETYAEERMAFARQLLRTTDTFFSVVASRSRFGSLFRTYILPTFFATAAKFKSLLGFAFRTISQTGIRYRESALSQGDIQELAGGDRLPWLSDRGEADNFQNLQSLDWQVHVYGQVKQEFRTAAGALARPVAVYEYGWTKECETKGFLRNAAYLIRPDGHIGALFETQSPLELLEYCESWGFRDFTNSKKSSPPTDSAIPGQF